MSGLLWVAVPGGPIGEAGAMLRALVVPRLSGGSDDADLRAYGLADWPALLAGSSLTVEVAPDPLATPTAVPDVVLLDSVRPLLWPKVFPPTLHVPPYVQPPTYPVPRVEPSARYAQTVTGIYAAAGKAVGDPGEIERQLLATDLGTPPPHPIVPVEAPTPAVPVGFHMAVSLLREHPAVLRALGLVVDLRLPGVGALAPAGVVRVRCALPADAPAGLSVTSPWTSYIRNGSRFLPAPGPESDIREGMVDLSAATWQFATFDVSGGIARARDTARTITEAAKQPVSRNGRRAPKVDATLPALRSAGLSLLRHDRARHFANRNARATANAVRGAITDGDVLTADDLVLGYRVDVRTSEAGWKSLVTRSARYETVDGQEIVELVEEGQVKANATTVVDDGTKKAEPGALVDPRTLQADEVVTRWDGGSLVTARRVDRPNRRVDPAGRTSASFMNWRFQPVGLPELRFGGAYRMRVRVADSAGGGLGLNDPELTEAMSREVFYGRHDPLPPPQLIPPVGLVVQTQDGPRLEQSVVGPGGALDVLVIRSDPATGLTVEQLATRFRANDQRMLLPPAAPFAMVEQHGHLDEQAPEQVADWLRRATTPPAFTSDGAYSWLPDPAALGCALFIRPEPGAPEPGSTAHEAWQVPSGAWPDFPSKSLRLEARATGQAALDFTAQGHNAVVRLAPAEQVTVEVTSTVVPDDIDKFEMRQWLDGLPETSDLEAIMELVRNGRHPMVSPPTLVRLVHAVQHPLRPPAGDLVARRERGQTTAVVGDEARPRLDLDSRSTAQVELTARWDERVDAEPPSPVGPVSVQVDRLDVGAPELDPFVHELGDTKHRMVTYTVTALSRFRQCFEPAPDTEFQAAPLVSTISVPSTAPPPVPAVRSGTPSFRWTGTELPPGWDTVERVRDGGSVRVELDRPWFVSGDGECLAVLVRPPGDVPERARGYFTIVRRDPIRPTPVPATEPEAGLFVGAVRDPVQTTVEELLDRSTAEQEVPLLAVPYAVRFAPQEPGGPPGCWYADIQMPGIAASSYTPFVKLALARYQPESLAGVAFSAPVQAEPVQLLPERRLTVRRGPSDVTVVLRGLGPEASASVPPNRVTACLERLPAQAGRPDLTAARADLGVGWQRAPGTLVSGALNEQLAAMAIPAGDESLRLVVREVEQFPGSVPADTLGGELDERTVFVDVIPIR